MVRMWQNDTIWGLMWEPVAEASLPDSGGARLWDCAQLKATAEPATYSGPIGQFPVRWLGGPPSIKEDTRGPVTLLLQDL